MKMQELFIVFFINLVSDIDNMLILGTILRKHSYLNITLPAAMVLTLTRTIYVVSVNGLSNVPMVHLLTGIILLVIAFKLVTRSIREEDLIYRSKHFAFIKIKVLLLLAATDFLICLDSVIAISNISQHVVPVTIGIFCSLLISLFYLPLIIKLVSTFAWINIIVGGVIAQNAIIGIVNDPWLANWINKFDKLFPEANMVNLISNGVVIIIVVIGLISYIKHQRITIHR
ncbi:TerC family protein [Peribacillus butanolivorans]|uniref:TerC family protein n=1 Tax=Peribacillus butanolivorans TaxID=421767 RepID=UPI0036AAF5B7